jgi:pimeloyl-ACP methyl ester carboxylesterase
VPAGFPPFATDEGQGPDPVVLLHGFGGWHGVWATVASGLGGRVLAYDLPGHGRSLEFPGAGPAKLAASAILADLAGRGVEAAHLTGHSMGGAIAVLMAIASPDRVLSLTLLSPGGFGEDINGPLLRRFAAARSPAELAACLAGMSGPASRIDGPALARLAAMRARPGQTEKLVGIAEAITRGNRQGVIGKAALDLLPMPVAVLWGRNDPVLPFGQTANLPDRFRLHPIDGAGHMLIEEAPEPVTRTIRQMARHGPPSASAASP